MKHSLVAWRITPQGHTYRDLTEQERKVSGGRNRPDRQGMIFRCSSSDCRKEVYVTRAIAQRIIDGNRRGIFCNKECYSKEENKQYEMKVTRALEGKEPWTYILTGRYVWRRDGPVCQVCDCASNKMDYQLGHKVDDFLGGPYTPENITIMCHTCNELKPPHDTLEEYEAWVNRVQTLRPRLLHLGLTDSQANAAIEIFHLIRN